MAPRPTLDRLVARPTAEAWDADELVSLAEAAALFFPAGPLSAASLRAACRRGELACVSVCGKAFTTPRAVQTMKGLSTKPICRSRLAEGAHAAAMDGAAALVELRRRLTR